ncbi:hypothetical protein MA16_Dca004260 [Dendrobium catenatum]|uniref:Uncharacterized protein n=1 Tax=Dendrobium catenatum TaxID=906689 RepID=A0A2I0W6Y0_9ASPA|nr:hypothetical protein MA16_Dca004260 [Dendrobium catenatum]
MIQLLLPLCSWSLQLGNFSLRSYLVTLFLFPLLLKQMHLLQSACDEDKSNDESFSSGTELVLHRRIAEVKANERRRAI